MKYIDAEKLIAEIERLNSLVSYESKDRHDEGLHDAYKAVKNVITSLQQEQSKFNIGDLIVSKNNPHLTYKILATNIPNELGKMDYKVEIFTDGKSGLLNEPHNIHLISSDKIEDWGELIQQEQPDYMIQWTGNNLKDVIDFTGRSPRFEEWFKSWEEYENYVHTHNDILKLFCEDGSHYEVPVGAWIVKTPDGHNVPSIAKYIQKEQPEVNAENNGWIDCRKQMPKETKQWSDTLQGHREWTESEPVLAWDSVYGCRVDATKNGKWMSEQKGGYTGQIVHSIIAWRPIPEFFV